MARRRLGALLCTALAAGVLLSACDTSEKGQPTSGSDPVTTTSSPVSSSATTSETPSLPFAGAPKVANPLDAKSFLHKPCLALTSSQVSQLKVDAGKRRKGNRGMVCDWSGINGKAWVDLQFFEDSREGLSSIYRANDNGAYGVFSPIGEIEGFPSVALGEESDKSTGLCTVDIGLTDELVVQISTTQSEQKRSDDPCESTKAVAGLILQNMKAGA